MKYSIHKEGYVSIVIAIIFTIVVYFLSTHFLYNIPILIYILNALALGVLGIVLWFFRIPDRKLTIADGQIIAPADGTVVVIEETVDVEYFKDKRVQVSIFMSPLNVHVNRNPLSGIVKYVKYHPGKYLAAWNPKSSTDNERHTVVIENNGQEILVKQIAGMLARRIVNYLSVGDNVSQTEEYGFIKFGSRVDMMLPLGTKVNVNLQDKVQGGMTVIATLPK